MYSISDPENTTVNGLQGRAIYLAAVESQLVNVQCPNLLLFTSTPLLAQCSAGRGYLHINQLPSCIYVVSVYPIPCAVLHQPSNVQRQSKASNFSTYRMVLVDGVSTVPHKYCRKRLSCFDFLQSFIGMLAFGFWFSTRHNKMGPQGYGPVKCDYVMYLLK